MAGPLTITLFEDGDLTYVIAPYGYEGITCASAAFPGSATS